MTAPMGRTRAYERLSDWLLSHIANTRMLVGDQFPPERELAKRFGASRASVRQALAALESQGIIAVRQGDGTYLRRQPEQQRTIQSMLERRKRLPEVLEARAALEVNLAGLAARRRDATDLASMRAALETMDTDIAEGGIGAEGDERFHAAVTAAAHNKLMAELMSYLAGLIHETRLESLTEPGRPPRSSAQHRRIAEAIERSDVAGAEAAMREHIQLVGDVAILADDLPVLRAEGGP
ncbi:MAG: FadR family transcriptional regulator [Euzebyales bacterium]|jgi:GntR family transcriptional repressor for pyruvate dehydrogenase complex|nr:FadR family transcriptional regulator [Euzebyales bacterium]